MTSPDADTCEDSSPMNDSATRTVQIRWLPGGMRLTFACLVALLLPTLTTLQAKDVPSNQNEASTLMLAGDWLPEDPHQIDYEKLPRVPAEHVIISDVRDQAGTRVHQHAYLAHHDGQFWAMWSDGPGLPKPGATPEQHRNIVPGHDRPGTRNSFSTSTDGLHWSKPADLTGPPRMKGYGWIARGLWKRDGELLALASHFNAPGYAGLGLSLEAFRWNGTNWVAHGTVLDDSMNNFPPKRLPSGEWMMTRRDHQRQVSVMIGGTKAFNDWRVRPLAAYDGNGRPEEPYWYVLPDGKTIVGLIRDNGGSKFLLRTFSRDNGQSWSPIHRTNFPDATSKFFVHRTSRGYYVMVSNANPRQRDPLTLAISQDGLVFTKLFWLVGERHIDYPHIIEHDGHLLIAFSGAKQTMEVMRVSLDEIERLEMPESVSPDKPLPSVEKTPQQPPKQADWIDLGDEGKTLWAAADLVVPERGKRTSFALATAGRAERVTLGIDPQGRLIAQLYKETVTGPELQPGSRHSLLVRINSHKKQPDELFVQLGFPGEIPAAPERWTLSNTRGSSDANLSRVVLHGDADCSAGFRNVRVATTRETLAEAKVVSGKTEATDVVVYGGTPGGLASAIAAARLGSRVIVVEPNQHIGGMTTSGLGKSDIENRAMIGGLFLEFVAGQLRHYRDTYGPDHENIKLCRDGYYAEPSVSETVFEAMLGAEGERITVLKGYRLAAAHTSNDTLKSITIQRKKDGSTRRLHAKVFIDATYEGDLYAAAGAEYRIGRESRDEFNEPHAGVVYFDYQEKKFLPGTTGEASTDLPAFTYRLCLTKDLQNSHRLSQPPPGYDRSVYLGYFDDLKAGRLAGPKVLKPGRGYNPLHFGTLVRALSVTDIPNNKTDVNMNPRPLGFPFTEENRGYIEGDEATRDKIRERIRNLTLGLIWFLQNDSEVPAEHRKLANELHFPQDEFTDDGEHFPFQLYVREGRRLVGEITLTEHHITGKGEAITHHPDTIAIGEFPIDSFPCRKRQPGDTIVLEGYLGMLDHITRPYEIPYRVMIPKKVDGLIVPVAASTTHVAFSSIRMEPTWMALGQAAGTAAHLAIQEQAQPRHVSIETLQSTLRKNGQVLSHADTAEALGTQRKQ